MSDVSLGTVKASQNVTAANANQTLTEYGLFYSTNRDNVVAVSPSLEPSLAIEPIIIAPEVQHVRVITNTAVAPSEVGTLTVNAKHLTPGTKYYFRFYTVGHDSSTEYPTLYYIGSFTTANPTLKSIKTTRGKLSPTFSKTKYSYTNVIAASYGSAKITVAPTLGTSKVQMKIGTGSWSTVKSKTVAVTKGHSKTVYIRVTESSHHIVASYSVKVTRKSK
jgi:hypothetical protein